MRITDYDIPLAQNPPPASREEPSSIEKKVDQLGTITLTATCQGSGAAPEPCPFREALEALKTSGCAENLNTLLADRKEISAIDFRKLAQSTGVDLLPYQILSDEGRLVAVLRQQSSAAPPNQSVTKDSCLAVSKRARPAALASLLNHFRLPLIALLTARVRPALIQDALPLLIAYNLTAL
ncbi:MAG: hypothetical protein KDK78_09700, partial [Chlamydiia bacterium]|nr:hypothetical protein [Chlamydiia bacterium]